MTSPRLPQIAGFGGLMSIRVVEPAPEPACVDGQGPLLAFIP